MFTALSLPPIRSIKKTVNAKSPFEGYTLTCMSCFPVLYTNTDPFWAKTPNCKENYY